MKQGTAVNRIVMVAFALVILLYLGGAAWRGLRQPYPTAQAYAYEVDDTLEATGYLARQEQVLMGNGGIVRLIPGEGEKVAAGATVAYLYADQETLERSQRLEALETEAGQLTQAVAAAGDSGREESSRQQVEQAMTALRSSVSNGEFTRLENQVTAFKSAIYQQAQRYGEAGDISAALLTIQSEIDQLRATTRDVGRTAVTQSGIFSGQVDGYEAVLTPESLESLTPSDLDGMEGRREAVDPAGLGKLITDSTWYFVCPLPEEAAVRLAEGKTVTVRFSRDWAGEVDMTVERIGAPDNGRVSVVLSSRKFLSDTTLLRRQTVELVFDRRTGIRVPTAAVRMEDGESVVYVKVGVTAEKKPVSILAQGEDYYLVEPMLSQDPEAKEEKLALRVGDQVIVAREEIWDGKIVE